MNHRQRDFRSLTDFGSQDVIFRSILTRPGRIRKSVLLGLLLALLPCPALAANGQAFVLIVSGHPGNELFARHYRDRITRFHKYFSDQAQVPAANITALSGETALKDGPVAGSRSFAERKATLRSATAESILAALAELEKKVKPEDQFILVLLGHGATTEDGSTLMMPGADLDVAVMAKALGRIAAENQVVLNFASNSGDTIARLSRAGRVVITASSPGQVNDSDFAEFFLQALETGAGDDGAGNVGGTGHHVLMVGVPMENGTRRVPSTLLAVYNWAVLHTAEWTVRQKAQDGGHTQGWIVEGKQSAEIFKRLYSGPDVPPDRRFVPSPASEQSDAPVKGLVAANDEWWTDRRAITETPALADVGPRKGAAATGASALGDKGYQPLRGATAGAVGFLARRVVLGDPQLLSVETVSEPAAPAKPAKPLKSKDKNGAKAKREKK